MSYFPSLEEIDEGQTEVRTIDDGANGGDVIDFGVPDTEADFVAREKAVLGDSDAAALTTDGGDLLSGDEPGFINGSETSHPFAASSEAPETIDFEPQQQIEEEEPDVIKEWRERRELAIQRRDEQSKARKQETLDAAKQNIDDFYDNYNDKKDKAIAQTRAEEKEFIESQESTVSGGTTWERIAKLVDLSEKNARTAKVDKTRFRELLLSLKSDPNAPGAKGY
ncbi:clathrin light chain [Kockiozyma suomiensis]|uniref:clathrin light chain n=1 Tax=Kockiozyma suomiensis TaxID=1337062 RepID=UPI00334391D4